MNDDYITLVAGMEVYDSAGDHLGTVVQTAPDYVVVAKGVFFPTDAYIPLSAIDGTTRDGKIYLTATKDVSLNQGWDRKPSGTSRTADSTDEAIRVPVYEETLTAVTREVERGAVRIEKDVVAEDRTMEVPVTEERVRVSRVEADANAPSDPDHVFEDGVIEVPLTGQEVDLEKTARVAGEVVVEKEAVQRTERVGGTVRREEVRVDDRTVEVDDARR